MGKHTCSKLKMLSLVTENGCKINLWCSEIGHTSSLFYDLRILKMPDMVQLKTAEIMYKVFNNSSLNNIYKLFVLYDHMYMTQHKYVFKQKYAVI